MTEAERRRLESAARNASERAYAPYSGFKVGAAVLTADGEIYSGCNVENASYSLTMCAERTALFNAIANGAKDVIAVALYTDTPELVWPCGACRQVVHELAEGATVVTVSPTGGSAAKMEGELLPDSFSRSDLP